MKQLSIIIPVYNTEKYVEQCLKSCLLQDLPFRNYEIVVVNDGTKDLSMNIVNQIAAEYSNVVVLNQENKGLSAARNTGLSYAQGKYIWFIDSDDWIENNCLREIIERMDKDDLEGLVHAGIRYIDDDNVLFVKTDYPSQTLSGRDYMASVIINCAAVKTIYRRDFLYKNHLLFYEGIYHEDLEFTPRAYYFIDRLGFTNHHYYYNRLTPGSITQKPNPKKAFDLITVARNLYEFKNNHESKSVSVAFDNLIGQALNLSLFQHYYMNDHDLLKLNKEFNNNKDLLKSFLKSSILKYKIEGLLFSLSPSHCVGIYSLLHKYNVYG